jgi:L-alanine-DL-glutamate epimerase-like enolase superfamily enzyme
MTASRATSKEATQVSGSTIESISVTPFTIPLAHEVTFATGRLTHAEHLLVRVRTSDGVVGVAEAIPRPMIYGETAVSIAHVVERFIAPAAVGLDVLAGEELAHRLRHLAGNPTARGAAELAIFDAAGRTLGVSCHRLLGGYAPSARATAILGAGAVPAVVAEATELRDTYGIDSFKVKVGMAIDRDIALIERLRADHPLALIYVDANHGYSPADALTFLAACRDQRLAWIEEPCPAEDVLGRQEIVANAGIPVLGDESCTTTREVVTEVLGRRCTAISIKLARTGVLASTRIREFCAATGTLVLVGSQGDSGIGTYTSAAFAAATPATANNPAELAYFLNLKGDLLAAPPTIKDGRLAVPDGPGFGFDIDDDALARFRADAR